MKKYKEILIASIIIIIVILFQITRNTSSSKIEKVKNNTEINNEKIEEKINYQSDISVEKQYSMQTGDRFTKIGNIVIFSTYFDNCIYKIDLEKNEITNLCKLEDGILHLYFDGNYIYCMPYYYMGKGIYKIDLSGNIEKIYNGASLQLWITNDEIYFVDQIGFDDINQIPQGNLCKMDKSGNNKQVIIENVRNNFTIYNNKFYYIDNNSKGVFSANIDGTEKRELAKGRNSITAVTDEYVCFIDFSDNQRQKVVYLDNNEVVVTGMFGNVQKYDNKTYTFSRKIINSDDVEYDYTMYEIEGKNIKELFKTDGVLSFLYYIYEDYAYIRDGNDLYRVNLKNESREKIEEVNYFIGDKAYGFNSTDTIITSFNIYDLKENKIEKIEY